jgi:hypothetical protein
MRSFWLRVIVLVGVVLAVQIFEGGLRRAPATSIVPVIILVGLWYYFHRKMSNISLLVDEVFDCDTSIKVRRGSVEEMVPLSNISKVEVPMAGVDRIAVHFAMPTTLGQQIDFIPANLSKLKSWSLKLAELNRLAADLNARANRAQRVRVV